MIDSKGDKWNFSCETIRNEPVRGCICGEERGKGSQREELPITQMSYCFTNGHYILEDQEFVRCFLLIGDYFY